MSAGYCIVVCIFSGIHRTEFCETDIYNEKGKRVLQEQMASDNSGVQVEEVVPDEGGGDSSVVLEVFNLRTIRPEIDDIFNTSVGNLRATQIHGRGLFAGNVIKAGDFIGKYEGKKVTKTVSDAREVKYKQNGMYCYFMYIGSDCAGSTSL